MADESATGLEYLDVYHAELAHQLECYGPKAALYLTDPWRKVAQPQRHCFGDRCLEELRSRPAKTKDPSFELLRRYAWAVPNHEALDAIVEHSPGGVIELGAGGGYWAMELQRRGVDVLAFDPEPPGSVDGAHYWHAGYAWTAVHRGDHREAGRHPTRTLLLCWPSYGDSWAAEAVESYHAAGGEVVIYIGEGVGGCTADDRFHQLVGLGYDGCSCFLPDCECPPPPPPLFAPVTEVAIPQWSGLRDRLTVCRRILP